mgnify:CR=1 FL=1
MKTTDIIEINIGSLFEKIASVIEEARRRASTAINLSEVYAKFNVGRYIVEDEQGGKERAAYGKQVLEQLSKKIEERFGEGWSVETLKRCRKFYSMYSTPQIGSTVLTEFNHHPQSLTNSSSHGHITLSLCVSRMPMRAASMK